MKSKQKNSLNILLQATQITKQLGHRIVLRGVDLSVDREESVAIFGPNGAGKTTFINILATLMKPTSGVITIDGEDLKNNPFRFREQIGPSVPQAARKRRTCGYGVSTRREKPDTTLPHNRR